MSTSKARSKTSKQSLITDFFTSNRTPKVDTSRPSRVRSSASSVPSQSHRARSFSGITVPAVTTTYGFSEASLSSSVKKTDVVMGQSAMSPSMSHVRSSLSPSVRVLPTTPTVSSPSTIPQAENDTPEMPASSISTPTLPSLPSALPGFWTDPYLASYVKNEYLTAAVKNIVKLRATKGIPSPELASLPKRRSNCKGTVVWDLDGTLWHAPKNNSRILPPSHINVRPYAKHILALCRALDFEVILWTAAQATFAKPRLQVAAFDYDHLLTRTQCIQASAQEYIKDLRSLGESRPLSTVVIVDDNLVSFAHQPGNGIPMTTYHGQAYQPSDCDLLRIVNLLKSLGAAVDRGIDWRKVVKVKLQPKRMWARLGHSSLKDCVTQCVQQHTKQAQAQGDIARLSQLSTES
ncbi:hypothetical protein KIPB_001660 [Kipferlia bialata]|uniref:Mitochondrial import inner membrane translocase subunit TIM50 n=1 Tax=Kipferlia bialata TaxID=797122 RepID=A0A391NUK9_9EUKA|nr:hypothetical protein KIPB_001660 [Kipferlia bialata]|eukprot:g1660.t1